MIPKDFQPEESHYITLQEAVCKLYLQLHTKLLIIVKRVAHACDQWNSLAKFE